jgi:hypothetical protein
LSSLVGFVIRVAVVVVEELVIFFVIVVLVVLVVTVFFAWQEELALFMSHLWMQDCRLVTDRALVGRVLVGRGLFHKRMTSDAEASRILAGLFVGFEENGRESHK